jgi:hypothetical protein
MIFYDSFARAKMHRRHTGENGFYSDEQIKNLETLTKTNQYSGTSYRARKSLCRFVSAVAKQGFVKVRVDGKITTSPPE